MEPEAETDGERSSSADNRKGSRDQQLQAKVQLVAVGVVG